MVYERLIQNGELPISGGTVAQAAAHWGPKPERRQAKLNRRREAGGSSQTSVAG